ncbi:cation diffusion facilitator family transporter [Iodidimonas muriae]|nr:cation diffusion facilitator family transporter [Iodidimonas muriae]
MASQNAHHHNHPHHHHSGPIDSRNERRTFWAMLLIAGFMLVEVAGALFSGSLALLADAGHMLTDAAALALAWTAFRLSRRPTDHAKTYGYYRFEVVAAFINGLALLILVGWILWEAVERLITPPPVLGGPMLAVAIVGLLVNLVAFRMLHGADQDNLNIRAALWHVIGDILGSIAAIIAGLVIVYTGWTPIDPILSLLVAMLLVRAGWSLTKRTLNILMEGAPEHLDLDELRDKLIQTIPQVTGVHHLHVWLLTMERPMLTVHIEINTKDNTDDTLIRIKRFLSDHYGITHSTIQIEREGCADHPYD